MGTGVEWSEPRGGAEALAERVFALRPATGGEQGARRYTSMLLARGGQQIPYAWRSAELQPASGVPYQEAGFMDDRPEWLQIGDRILGPLLADTSRALQAPPGADFHVANLPTLALYHLASSLQTSIDTNRHGRHAVALSLLRHAVEALTIVELGLVSNATSYRLLEDWDSGKKSQGELRRALEESVWPQYGNGLWDEPWSEFFARLAKAVQPYAHCSPELLQWSLSPLTDVWSSTFVAAVGKYDPVKASRLMLFHILVAWTLGRILSANRPSLLSTVKAMDLKALGVALSESDLLTQGEDWSVQLWPHTFFRK